MRIRKAVITAAGGNQRALPLQTLIHDGAEKSVLSILIEQALTKALTKCNLRFPEISELAS